MKRLSVSELRLARMTCSLSKSDLTLKVTGFFRLQWHVIWKAAACNGRDIFS